MSDKAALAPYFLIFDEKGNLVETIDNPFKEKKLEAGKLLADFLPEKGVTAIIGTDYCGDIIDIFKNKGVTAYNFEGSAAQAVAALVQGKLTAALQEDTLVDSHKVMMEALRTGQEKIAVAANGDAPGAPVNAQAASSPYFLVFDQKGKLLEALENPYKNAESPGPERRQLPFRERGHGRGRRRFRTEDRGCHESQKDVARPFRGERPGRGNKSFAIQIDQGGQADDEITLCGFGRYVSGISGLANFDGSGKDAVQNLLQGK